MTENKSMLCPKCRSLISNYVSLCPNCGLKKPGSKVHALRGFLNRPAGFIREIITLNLIFFLFSHLLSFALNKGMSLQLGDYGLGFLAPAGEALFHLGMSFQRSVYGGGEWWRIFTAIFLHGGLIHIIFNMVGFYQLGSIGEALFRPLGMLMIFLLAGAVGNFLHITFSESPVVGASGGVLGLMGAIIVVGFLSKNAHLQQIAGQLVMWGILMVGMGFSSAGGRISHLAHLGGFVTGALLGFAVVRSQGKKWQPVFLWIAYGAITASVLSIGIMVYQFVTRLDQI